MTSNTAYNSIGRAKTDSTDVWATPTHVIEWAEKEFGSFDLDAAASESNAVCENFIDEAQDALKTDWNGKNVWCNPPYGTLARKFVQRALHQLAEGNCEQVVMLLACRTDTQMFQDDIFPNAARIHFVRGRLSFGDGGGRANFASAIVVFNNSDSEAKITYGKVKV